MRVCTSWEEEAEADREFWLRFSPEERVALMDTMRGDWAELNGQPKPARGHVELLRCLSRRAVRVLVVGPHALAFHTKPHYTDQLALFVEATEENTARLRSALEDIGRSDMGLQVEIATSIDGVTFEDAWRNRVEASYAGVRMSFIGANELLRHKDASTSLQDRADAELLRRFVKSPPE